MNDSFDNKNLQVSVEFGGYRGAARLKRVGKEIVKWEISIYADNGREICYWDGPEVLGDKQTIISIDDIEKAQHEINQAIEQFIWDPMSKA